MFGGWAEEKLQQGHRRGQDSDMMVAHRVKGIEVFSVVPGTQRALLFYCCMLIVCPGAYWCLEMGSK